MKNLTQGNPLKLILQFALPLFIGQLFQLFYSLADTRIVGETLGKNALAAVGAAILYMPAEGILIYARSELLF